MLIFARSRGATELAVRQTELAVRQNELNEVGRKNGVEMGGKKERRRPRRDTINIAMGADFMIGDNI
jgi:hypothetical protein